MQLPLDVSTIDTRMDAHLESVIERLAAEAHAEIHKLIVFHRRGMGQNRRFARERITREARNHG